VINNVFIKITITSIVALLCWIFYKLYDIETNVDINALALCMLIKALEQQKEDDENVQNRSSDKQ